MPRKATGQLILREKGYYGRYLATVDGVRKHVMVFLETRNEIIARQRLDALVAAEEAGRAPSIAETFGAAAKRVHDARLKTHPSSTTEVGNVRKHVNPVIGHIAAREVTKADVMSVLEAVRNKGHAQQTIANVRNAVAVVFKALRREGVVKELPVPGLDELPESLPESVDVRPKAMLSDEELLHYLKYTEPSKGEGRRGALRERQLMTLFSRCVGGMRTGELQGLTWTRARAEDNSFEALEVIRYKTRRKASRAGSKAVARQLYSIGDTVLPYFLRYWHVRSTKLAGVAPAHDSVVFPVRRERARGQGRVGERRAKSTWARALRRDIKRAFGLEAFEGGKWVEKKSTDEYSRRLLELLEGTDDRRPLWFHSSRNAAAVMAERQARLSAAAKVTGHASGRMLQHYREMVGEVDVVPVLPELLPDAERLVAILRAWCAADELDPALVFSAPGAGGVEVAVSGPTAPGPASNENAPGKRTGAENDRKPPHAAPCNVVALPVVSPYFAWKVGLRNRKSEVRILPGALEIPGTSPTPFSGAQSDKSTSNPHHAGEAAENGSAGVVALPPGSVTLADIRQALDAALLDGDLPRARRLNALAAELEALGMGGGGRRGGEEEG